MLGRLAIVACVIVLLNSAAIAATAEYPLPEAVSDEQRAVLSLLPSASKERTQFEAKYARRVADRVPSCSHDANPRECLRAYDIEVRTWLKQNQVSLRLQLPPLRLRLQNHPRYLVGDEDYGYFAFAQRANVSLFSSRSLLQVIDIGTGDVLLSMPLMPNRDIVDDLSRNGLSPNGQLIAEVFASRVAIRRVTDGATIIEYFGNDNIFWLDSETILLTSRGAAQSSTIVDLKNNLIAPVVADGYPYVDRAYAIDGQPNRYALCFNRLLHTVEVARDGTALALSVTTDQESNGNTQYSCKQGELTLDHKSQVVGRERLFVSSLESLSMVEHDFAQLVIRDAIPTLDPHRFVVTAYVESVPLARRTPLLVSTDDGMVAQLDTVTSSVGRLLFIPSLPAVGIHRDASVEILDLPSAPHFETPERLIDRLRKAQQENQYQDVHYGDRQSEPMVFDPALAAIAADADVIGVGTYESDQRLRSSTPPETQFHTYWGKATVHIGQSDRPLVLVLSSHQPLEWTLDVGSSTRVVLVLMSGNEASYVANAGTLRSVVIGSPSVSARDSLDYDELNRVLTRLIGKQMSAFEGSYRGSSFRVGGK